MDQSNVKKVSRKTLRAEYHENKAKVYELLKLAHENNGAVTRQQLIKLTNRSDVAARRLIHSLRKDGIVICSSAHSVGYYLPSSVEELEKYAKEYRAKAMRMLKISNLQEHEYYINSSVVAKYEVTKPEFQTENMKLMAKVYEILLRHKGQDNAITRRELQIITGRTDKKVRDIIKYLREEGKIICSTARSKGYYLPADDAEFRQYIAEYRAKAYKMLDIIDKQESQFKKILQELAG